VATAPPPPQRAYRAACPNCGAPVDFLSAASSSAVCSFCRSTLVRDGEALRRIGQSAELFDDHSPLQPGAGGRYQGVPFTLVGRLQYAYAEGTWNEWHALFDSGRSGWLSEDNGRYVFSFDAPLSGEVPAASELVPGERRLVGRTAWNVASVTRAHLLAAQGELPAPPRLDGEFIVADLRNEQGEVGTLDYGDAQRIVWSVGRSVALAELSISGLREVSEKTLSARGVPCPSCGTALEPKLSSTQSITCPQCQAVVDISQGVGADLQHHAQNTSGRAGIEPQIPLGSSGTLRVGKDEPLPWQVVGYQERCDIPASNEDEQTFWREYLLYHRTAGFAFLVDAEDGWSLVRPLTGAPQVRGDQALWQGAAFRKRYSYSAKVTYVLGEFYWRVKRDESALVTDYHGVGSAARQRLSREQTGSELTWSHGEIIDAAKVAEAFGIAPAEGAALQRDVSPLATKKGGGGLGKPMLIFLLIMVVIIIVDQCSGDDCDQLRSTFGEASTEYQQCKRSGGGGAFRTGGGSFGGFSSGGGHK
jgi:Domain of unknown function (DUF4178)